LKFTDENGRIQIRILQSEARIRGSGSGSIPKCHEPATLLQRLIKRDKEKIFLGEKKPILT
jgi:hypothetical protein